jgi:PhoPQ-activated pathogenicity-related protein
MMLWKSKEIPRPKPYQHRDVIAVDINEKKIVYGDDGINKERDAEIDEAHRWKLLAESLRRDIPLRGVLHGGGENLY